MLLWISVCKFLCAQYVFTSPGYIPRSGIAGSYGYSMFSLLRNCQIVFQSSSSIYIPTSSVCMKVLHSLHFCQHLLSPVSLIIVDVKLYFIVVLICISLMTKDIEHFFKCLLTICISSLEKYLFVFLSIFQFICLFIIELKKFFI